MGFHAGMNNLVDGSEDGGLRNIFLGAFAGEANTTGYKNVAMGYGALKLNTIGDSNVAIGQSALSANMNLPKTPLLQQAYLQLARLEAPFA